MPGKRRLNNGYGENQALQIDVASPDRGNPESKRKVSVPTENLNGLLPDMHDLASFESERLYEYALMDGKEDQSWS